MAIDPDAGAAAASAPSGTVAFLFVDIDGYARKADVSPRSMEAALRQYGSVARAILEPRGYVFKSVVDGFFVAFASVATAVATARALQRAIVAESWTGVDEFRARVAVHVGSVESRDGDYFGRPLNRAARILGVAHGGQILLSAAAADLSQEALVDGAALRDLGAHRLRDLETAERIFQFVAPELPAEFPRLRSLQATPNNLPVQLTRFIGREDEFDELRSVFRSSHLLTLLGFGGVGKTRFALQLAAEALDRFPGGAWFVDLSPIADGELVVEELARAVGVTVPSDRSALDATIEALRDRETLLIFDGCEHLLQAAASALDAILRACPLVRAIATTREALAIGGETVYAVEAFASPPETVASAREASAYPAVQLFVERSTAASAHFAMSDDNASAVSEICRRLDGIPLALELAAPKLAVLSPRQLADRLGDRFRLLSGGRRTALPRQQTLRALIDWSFDLLRPEERAVFRRLASFAGSWTLSAASEVCEDDEIDAWSAFDLAAKLVAKSLVVSEAAGAVQRFHMLDSIRAYGREKLLAAGEADRVAERAARYFAGLLATLDPLVDAFDEDAWREAVAPEIDNLRSAADWTLVRTNDLQLGRTLLARLDWPQSVTTPREAIRWFDLAAGAAEPFASAIDEARFYRHYARLGWLVGRPIAWRESEARRGLDAARSTNDPASVALALKHLAGTFLDRGDYDRADELFAEALAFAVPRKVRTSILVDGAINDLERGELVRARERFASVAQLEKPGTRAHGAALLNLAELAFATGDVETARASGRTAKDVLDRLHAAPLALLACNRAAYEMAADAFDDARIVLREALERTRDSGQVWTITALEHHAVYFGLRGALDRAVALLGYTSAQIEAGGAPRKSTERNGYVRLRALLVEAIGEIELERRFAFGAAMTREQALALAAEIHVT
jgi:predicted ATPase/class 3 adenylate cyclase